MIHGTGTGTGTGTLRLLTPIDIGFRPRHPFTRNLYPLTNRLYHHTPPLSLHYFLPGLLFHYPKAL